MHLLRDAHVGFQPFSESLYLRKEHNTFEGTLESNFLGTATFHHVYFPAMEEFEALLYWFWSTFTAL